MWKNSGPGDDQVPWQQLSYDTESVLKKPKPANKIKDEICWK